MKFPTSITLCCLALGWAIPLLAADGKKPNIVFIVGDDMGYADEGFHGCQDLSLIHI